MSDYNKILALLDKFWEGETTLEEEGQLKSYFATDAVDERLRKYAPLFQALREEQAVQLNKAKVVSLRPQQYQWQNWAVAASIIMLLSAGLWWLFSTPVEPTIIADKPNIELPNNKSEETINPEPATPTLAAIEKPTPKRKFYQKRRAPKPTISPEEEAAMEEIKAALALVSSKIRKGRHEAAKGASHLENIDKIFIRKEG